MFVGPVLVPEVVTRQPQGEVSQAPGSSTVPQNIPLSNAWFCRVNSGLT
jgi:hypothetical protein